MTNTFKHKLLLGTALVAVGSMASASAHAITLTADGQYASAGGANSTVDIDNLQADENINLDGNKLDIVNDQTADDGGGTDSFSIGAITDSASDGTSAVSLNIDNGDGNAGSDFALAIDSVSVDGAITIDNAAANDGAVTVTVTGALTTLDATNGDVTLTVGSDVNAKAVTLNVGGAMTVADDLTLTSSNGAGGGANAVLDVNGNLTVTGASAFNTVGAGNTLVTLGGNATFTGGLTIEHAAAGNTSITLDGSVLQTIAGDIEGATGAEGIININNTGTAGVVFTGQVGTTNGIELIDIGADNTAETVTFKNNVKATAITFSGNGDADDVTMNVDTTTVSAITVTGNLSVDNGADDILLNVTGGGKVTFDGTIADVDTFTIAADTDAVLYGATAAATTTALSSATSGLTLGEADAEANSTVTLTGSITGAGTVTLVGDDDDALGHTISNDVGTSTTSISTLTVKNDNEEGATTSDVHTLQADLYATSVVFAATDDAGATTVGGSLRLSGATAISTVSIGSITTAIAGDGNLLITPAGGNAVAATVTGNVGTSTLGINTITVGLEGSAGVASLDFDGNVYASQITIDQNSGPVDAIVSFTGGTQTVTADIDGQEATEGDVNVGNGTSTSTVTFSGQLGEALSLSDFKVFTKSTAILSGADGGTQREHEFAGDVTIDGTLRISENALVTANDVAVGTAAGVLEFVIGTTDAGVDESGTLDLAAAIDWDEFDGTTANSHDTLLKQGTGVILNNQDFFLIDGDGATLVANLAVAGETVDDEYALFNFKAYSGNVKTVGGSDLSDVVVEATHADADDVTINTNNSNAAEGLLDVSVAEYAADTDGANELALVYDNVTRANSSQIDERLEAIQPTVDGGNVVAATSVANITSNIIQLASVDAEGSGIAAGNISNGLRAWGQVFGQTGKQDARDGIDGYDIDSFGFAVGLDTQALADQMVIGLAFSYADSEVDSDNANNTTTEIDTYQITLYGTYNVDEATYVSGQLGYAFGDNSTERNNLGGVAAVDAHGDFDSNQFIARLEAGRAYEVGSMTTLTPKILANYNYYDADSYSETGAGGAGLNVDQDTLHVFELGAGVDASWMFQQADGSYTKPEVRLGARYDLADDQVEATSNFLGGGAAFKTEGWDPQQFAVDVGAGVTYFSTTNWELTANYDYEWKEDYDSHAGFLRAAYKF